MMGQREGGQRQFFYAFDLDKVVPTDHLVRQFDAVPDLNWVHRELAPYYSRTGRPSIDPALMIRMLIVGYVFGIRSERRICGKVQVKPCLSLLLQARHRGQYPRPFGVLPRAARRFRESDALRQVFESVVAKCIAAG
jgi:transposase